MFIERHRFRRLWLGLQTLTGLSARGVFIPYRHAEGIRRIDYPAFETLFERDRGNFEAVLDAIQSHASDLARFGGAAPAPRFEQDWFPRLDLAATYAIIRREGPRRIVEIGSGHSTRAMARALRDGRIECELVCIDPQPRASIHELGIVHHPFLLADADPEILAGLGEGHVLFIDSSHVAVPGSDVDILFNTVLPRVDAGCLVHVHDVFLPWAYPAGWQWRGYNEQMLVAALLQSGAFEVIFASRYASRCGELMARAPVLSSLPLLAGAEESSIWMRKRTPAIG
ncbi:MAG: class I SAM-dependent methyltransferase [Geminicoccaceae bacterium]